MNELHDLQQLATTPIREDGQVRDGSMQAWTALEVLRTTSRLWQTSPSHTGCNRCKGDMAEKGVK